METSQLSAKIFSSETIQRRSFYEINDALDWFGVPDDFNLTFVFNTA